MPALRSDVESEEGDGGGADEQHTDDLAYGEIQSASEVVSNCFEVDAGSTVTGDVRSQEDICGDGGLLIEAVDFEEPIKPVRARKRRAKRPREPLPQPPPRAASGDVPPPEVQTVVDVLLESGAEASAYQDRHGQWCIRTSGSLAGAMVDAGLASYAR